MLLMASSSASDRFLAASDLSGQHRQKSGVRPGIQARVGQGLQPIGDHHLNTGMDESERAALNAAAKALIVPIIQPVGDLISNAIGVIGGDQLAEYREAKRVRRRQAAEKVIQEAQDILKRRGVAPDPETPPEYLEEIIGVAQDNSIPELRSLYAQLAAAAVDPSRRSVYRHEFLSIIKSLEPVDIPVLHALSEDVPINSNRQFHIANILGIQEDQVALAFRNLRKLELTMTNPGRNHYDPDLSALGRQFIAVVRD